MFILTLLRMNFNTQDYIISEGDKKIPEGHFLFGKRVWKCGSYLRKLMLYAGRVIRIRIYRYYCLDDNKTYSLLPFFIQPYERHINTVIESVLEEYFKCKVDIKTTDEFSKKETPSEWTERRWIKKYTPKIHELNQSIAEYMAGNYPNHHPADKALDSTICILESLNETVRFVFSNLTNWIYIYGYISFCFWIMSLKTIADK